MPPGGAGFGAGVARVQAAAGDAELPSLKGCDVGQPDEAELGAAVRGAIWADALGGDAADIDDAPAALLFHDAKGGTRAEEGRPQIDGDDPVPSLGGKLVSGAAIKSPGVIDQDVQPSEAFHRLVKGTFNVFFPADIGRHCFCLTPQGDDFSLAFLDSRRVSRCQHDACPFLCQGNGDGFADSPAGTGHQGDLTVKLSRLYLLRSNKSLVELAA